jgi:hypothetical protein
MVFFMTNTFSVYFGWPWNGKCWYIKWPFGIFCGHLVYLVAFWYIWQPFGIFWWPFGIFGGHLVYSRFGMLYVPTKKNLATLIADP